jgi:hypothetical protein
VSLCCFFFCQFVVRKTCTQKQQSVTVCVCALKALCAQTIGVRTTCGSWKRQRGGMGKRSLGMSSWFEIAPPQIITVERCSPKQRTLETILEKVAAMGLALERAPPQIITVERCSPRPSTLDTIAEESMMNMGAGGGGGQQHLSSSSSSSSSSAADVLIPMNWGENTANSRLAVGFLAFN